MLTFALVLAVVTASPEPLTVGQAVNIALENSPSIRVAQLEVEKGAERLTAARTKRLPQMTFETIGSESLNRLSLEIEAGALGEFEATGPLPNEDTRIEMARTFSVFAMARVTQPITQLRKINLGIKLSESSLAVDREHERAVRQAITREVKAAYHAVLRAESAARAADEAVTLYDEVAREMTVRVAHQVALEADRLDSTAKLAAARVLALQAHNGVATARQHFNYLLGRELDTQFALAALPLTTGDVRTADAAARPDLREAALRIDQARLDMRMTAADRIPEVSLTVSHAMPFSVDMLPRNMTSAGVLVSYEPFTWGRRGAELTEKRLAIEQAENSLRDKRAAAELEIAAKRRHIEETAAQVLVQQLEADAARERLRVVRTRFDQQAARPEELYAAGASLTQATAREQEAISAYWTAHADYEQSIGQE